MLAILHPRVENPLPDKSDDNFRKDRRDKKYHPVKSFHADLAIAGQGQSKGQDVLKCQRDDRDERRVPHRAPPHFIMHELLKILQPDKLPLDINPVPFVKGKIENVKERVNIKNRKNKNSWNNKKKIFKFIFEMSGVENFWAGCAHDVFYFGLFFFAFSNSRSLTC